MRVREGERENRKEKGHRLREGTSGETQNELNWWPVETILGKRVRPS